MFIAVLVAVFAASADRAISAEIHDAAKNGDLVTVKALLQANPDVGKAKDEKGNMPLHEAAFEGKTNVVAFLLDNNVEVNATNTSGMTALHNAAAGGVAAGKGYTEVVALLLAKKANVDAKDSSSSTPLHWAVMTGHKDVVELLLSKGANPNAQDKRGRSPADRIGAYIPDTATLNAEMAALLKKHGGKRQEKMKIEDMTALQVAQDPATYGFEQGGTASTAPTEEGLRQGMKPSRTVQWTKKTPEGELYLLAITYEGDKMVSARWGGL